MSRCHYHTILFLNYNNVLSGIHLPATMIAWDELHPLKFSLIVGIKQYSFRIAWSGIVWIKIHYFTEKKLIFAFNTLHIYIFQKWYLMMIWVRIAFKYFKLLIMILTSITISKNTCDDTWLNFYGVNISCWYVMR